MAKSTSATQERKASPKAEPKRDTRMVVFAVLVPAADEGDVELPDSSIILGKRTLSLDEPSLSKTGRSLTLGNVGPRDAEGGDAPMVEATIRGHAIKARLGYGLNVYLTSGSVKEASPEAFRAAQFTD